MKFFFRFILLYVQQPTRTGICSEPASGLDTGAEQKDRGLWGLECDFFGTIINSACRNERDESIMDHCTWICNVLVLSLTAPKDFLSWQTLYQVKR